jgi:hypothetical protein
MDLRWYLKKLFYNKVLPPKPLAKSGHTCMVHIGRCGSTVLSNMVEQNLSLNWAGEIYEPLFKAWASVSPDFSKPLVLEKSPIAYLKSDMDRSKKPYYGFEVKPYHFKLLGQDPEEYFSSLEQLGFTKFILLDRANRLRKIVSSLLAHQSGVFHVSPVNFSRVRKRKITINFDNIRIDNSCKTLLEFLQDYDRSWANLCDILSDRDTLSLEYSRDIERDPIVGYDKVARFLDLPLKTPKVYYRRVNPYPLKDILENYDQLCSLLGDTKYSWMLES